MQHELPILPTQVRAARALIGWSQKDLAKISGVGVSTIRAFEAGRRDASAKHLLAFRKAFHRKGGIEFVLDDDNNGPGVRFCRKAL